MKSMADELEYIKRPAPPLTAEAAAIEEVVRGIVRAVRDEGDLAVRRYSQMFDHYDGEALEVGTAEREAAVSTYRHARIRSSRSHRCGHSHARSMQPFCRSK